MDLICLMALPGVSCGVIIGFVTWNAWSALRAFLISETVWLLALVVVAVVPAHGQSKGTWVNPVRNNRLMYDAVKARSDKDVLAAGTVGYPTRET
jgi:hypothetical protein